ncbi:hypothetical protein DI09_43p200 [Mitosporidium daphniae]|uniref:Uncharacterized protein n=1 Tax=Mitosporidium daphniae TaxID=1485682 RepID=A0A098VQ77_9MICR|nr:uncharacterized protein DI09_43p200 [Mitosporidium daphniae]KGG51145.1 hypothetical protein DI09_43p200 [Mitosporidium daphniae]|eukprot:XP_013237572.1 uncharacterized protein DI09_43p200 [Mitosporidium daphniae]
MNSAPNTLPPAQGFGQSPPPPNNQFPQNFKYASKPIAQSAAASSATSPPPPPPPPPYQQNAQGYNTQQQYSSYAQRQSPVHPSDLATGYQGLLPSYGDSAVLPGQPNNYSHSPNQLNSYPQSSNQMDNYSQSPFATISPQFNGDNQHFQITANAAKTAFDIFSMVGGAQSQLPYNQNKILWSWIDWPLLTLKPYFQVSHWYVDWVRRTCPTENPKGTHLTNTVPGTIPVQQFSHTGIHPVSLGVSFAPPREDVSCPDLYIPRMFIPCSHHHHSSCLHYLCDSSIHYLWGRWKVSFLIFYSRFTPDILGITSSSALVFSLLELFVVRTGFFILGLGSSVPILEYLAYVGYKYVGLVLIVSGGLLVPGNNGIITRLIWIYVSISYAVFALRSLKDILNLSSGLGDAVGGGLLPGGAITTIEASAAAASGTLQRRRVYFLLLVAALQAAFSYYLIIEPKFIPAQPPLGPT